MGLKQSTKQQTSLENMATARSILTKKEAAENPQKLREKNFPKRVECSRVDGRVLFGFYVALIRLSLSDFPMFAGDLFLSSNAQINAATISCVDVEYVVRV